MFSKASISQVLLSRLELHDGAGTGGGISDESKRAMTPTVWRPYPDRVRSSHWYELFADTQGDERIMLTWKGLFRDVDNTANFYSTRDEVVANGDGSWKWPLTRKFAWYNQEWARGAYLVSLSPLAGWKFSTYYSKTDVVGHLQGEEVYGQRRYTPAETFGVVVVSGRTGRSVSLRSTKAGYYGSAEEIGYAGLGLGVKDGYVMSWSDESTTETRDFAVRPMSRCRG